MINLKESLRESEPYRHSDYIVFPERSSLNPEQSSLTIEKRTVSRMDYLYFYRFIPLAKEAFPEHWRKEKQKNFKDYKVSESECLNVIVKKLMSWDFVKPLVCSILSKQTGIGKTHLAVSLGKKFIWEDLLKRFENEKKHIECNGDNKFYGFPRVHFASDSEILTSIQRAWKSNSPDSEYNVIEYYKEFDLLIIDDLYSRRNESNRKSDSFEDRVYLSIIDERMNKSKPTIITSNIECEEFPNRLSSRINNSMLIQIKTELMDHRSLD